MAINIHIEGMDEVLKELREAPREARRLVADVLKRAAREIQQDARSRCPVETGTLQRSIRYSVSKKKLEGRVYAGGRVSGRDAFYAPFVEYGTKTAHAQPFLFPAARAREEQTKEELEEALLKAMEAI
jgi:HK97 gp10 family phage protein